VLRHLAGLGLQPHRTEAFKLSTDPLFIDKVPTSWACTCRRPPMPCAVRDEKSQIQRWIAPNRCCRCPLVCRSDAATIRALCTTTLFAALDLAPPGHRRAASASSQRRVPEIPAHHRAERAAGVGNSPVMDNYSTHKSPTVKRGSPATALPPALHAHLRVVLNLVERWFAILTNARSNADRIADPRARAAIRHFLDVHNQDPSHSCAQDGRRIIASVVAFVRELTHQYTRCSKTKY